MRDFPIFETEYGVSSLILREVPYRQEAYIFVQATEEPQKLLEECISFSRVVGAERVYATGHDFLENYPLHTIIYEMRADFAVDETMVEHLWPVTEDTVGRWRELMNEQMAAVDHARTLDKNSEREILTSGGAYFVHHDGELLGGGWVAGEEIRLIVAAQPGAGRRVMHTLRSLIPGDTVKVEVVSTNEQAIRFYEKLGFIRTAEVYRWYRVHP